MKWVVWGTGLAVAPFTVLYAFGYIFDETAGPFTDIAILPLILIPLALGYSVVRYRLMDVELVVRRVAVYALTTLAIAVGSAATPNISALVHGRSVSGASIGYPRIEIATIEIAIQSVPPLARWKSTKPVAS